MKSRAHDEAMADLYRQDPAFALAVINQILEDGDQAELLIMLRQMTQAFGGIQAVASLAHLNPTQLYRTLSPKGNPALSSLSAILKAMGLRLAVQPLATQTDHLSNPTFVIRAKVQEALDDPRPAIPHEKVEAHFAKRRAAALLKAGKGGAA